VLTGLPPLLTPDLLRALAAMGHGDEIAVVDTNFPAASVAASTIMGEPILMAGVPAARAVEAILSVMPLDTFVPDPACRMEIVGDPDAVPPVQREVQQAVDRAASKHVPLLGIERFAFYERAKSAFAIVPTGERRFYGCFIFKKGVVPPE
jgi:L-fucose mutarotase